MKVRKRMVWMRSAGVCLLIGLFGPTALGAAAEAAASAGMVKRLVGAVTVVRGGQNLPASIGMRVLAGDELHTARAASVGVTFADNSVVSLGPNSRYSVERFRFNSTTHQGEFTSRLGRGSLAMVSGKLAKQSPDAVTVRTPSTMLGVRGTRFVVEVP